MIRVFVKFKDGSNSEFTAAAPYEIESNMVSWTGVTVGMNHYDIYSLPISEIRSVGEAEVEQQ